MIEVSPQEIIEKVTGPRCLGNKGTYALLMRFLILILHIPREDFAISGRRLSLFGMVRLE
jgi:hypothetical protein